MAPNLVSEHFEENRTIFQGISLDYQKWAKEMDFVSWDNYPAHDAVPFQAAMSHDLTRGLKQGASFG